MKIEKRKTVSVEKRGTVVCNRTRIIRHIRLNNPLFNYILLFTVSLDVVLEIANDQILPMEHLDYRQAPDPGAHVRSY